MMDAALKALTERHRQAEIDAEYEVYDRVPLSAPDEWGDLESFITAKWGNPPQSDNPDIDESAP